jgi:mono/diheme cytochrome c family protein
MRLSPLLLLLGALLASPGANAQEIGNPERGKVMAARLCAECHYTGAYDAESPNAKAAPFRMIANTRGMTAMALGVWMQTSHPTMPNIKLTPETMDDIIAYIRSLKSEPKPAPDGPPQ